MQSTTILFIGLVLMMAYVIHRNSQQRRKSAWLEHLTGWQKVFGVAGFLLALLIVSNPEFLVLGLLGDPALFDVLILALSLQLQSILFRVWHCIRVATFQVGSWLIRRAQLDCAMLAAAMVQCWHAALSVRRSAMNYLRPRAQLLA